MKLDRPVHALLFASIFACSGGEPRVDRARDDATPDVVVSAPDAAVDAIERGDALDAPAVVDAAPDPLDAPEEASADGDARPAIAIAIAARCDDALADVYVTPTLPAMTPASRGDVVRCANDAVLDAKDVQHTLDSLGITVTAITSVSLHRIAFRTTRGGGEAGVSTARVYLPLTPRSHPLPVIVAAHPSEGLADACAPSLDATSLRDLALPWAAKGYAVIAPDYAGLGNEGVQGYQDSRDTAHSVLDAARALRKLLVAGAVDERVLLIGYSQGGGAVLSAQAIEHEYGCDGVLRGVVSFAPQWASSVESFGQLEILRTPDKLTIATGITKPVIATMMAYAHRFNDEGAVAAGELFPVATRDGVVSALSTLCLKPYGGYIQGAALHTRDLFDADMRASLLACADDETSAKCVEPGKAYFAFLRKNVVHSDPSGGKILYVQGLLDTIMPVAEEAACNLDAMKADGVTPQLCVDSGADHLTVVARNASLALAWGQALLDGAALPSCAGALPPCLRGLLPF